VSCPHRTWNMAFQPSSLSGKPKIAHGHELRRFHDSADDEGPAPVQQRRRPPRDHRGNIIGGHQNDTMQAYVLEETLEAKEHKRWLAHRDASLHATFPTSLSLNGVDIPLFKMSELEIVDQKRLRLRAMNLRDLLEQARCNFFGHHRELALNANESADNLAAWIIEVQVVLAEAVGAEGLDHAAFGAVPRKFNAITPQQQRVGSFPWSQHGVHDRSRPESANQPLAPASFPWSQHAVLSQGHETPQSRGRVGQWREQPAQHQGFSLVPPHLASGGRMDDGMRIAQRGHGSSVMLG